MSATASQGIRYPSDSDAPNVPVWLQRLAEDAEQHGISYFASAADRTAKLAAPVAGQLSYQRDLKRYETYDGTGWAPVFPTIVTSDQASAFVPAADASPSNTYADIPSGTWAPLPFVVPASGKAIISVDAFVRNTSSPTATIRCAFRLSGGFTRNPGDDCCITTYGSQVGNTRRRLISGMTPGATVTVTPVWAAAGNVSGSTSTTITNGELMVQGVA